MYFCSANIIILFDICLFFFLNVLLFGHAMQELQKFILPMDGPHRRSAILRIADSCNVSRRTVTRWLENDIVIRDIFKKAINEEFQQQIFML